MLAVAWVFLDFPWILSSLKGFMRGCLQHDIALWNDMVKGSLQSELTCEELRIFSLNHLVDTIQQLISSLLAHISLQEL